MIHLYDLARDGEFLNTIPFLPSKFEDNGEHAEKYQYISGTRMLDGEIKQFFPLKQGIVVLYEEGIKEEIFTQNELNDPKNFPKYKDFQKQILKIVLPDSSLSNEINVPYRIGRIMNIEGVGQPFLRPSR